LLFHESYEILLLIYDNSVEIQYFINNAPLTLMPTAMAKELKKLC